MIGMYNDIWGGFQNALDVTRPDVLDHLTVTARRLVEAGYRYLKLDFTFSAKLRGSYADPGLTPAERVRARLRGRAAGGRRRHVHPRLRRAPGSAGRRGRRHAHRPRRRPHWGTDHLTEPLPGYRETQPSTRGAWRSTLARAFQHRQLWLNDPDCLMLRTQPDPSHPRAGAGVGPRRRRVRRHGPGVRRPGPAGSRGARPARRGADPRPRVRRRRASGRPPVLPRPPRRPDPDHPPSRRPHPRRRPGKGHRAA